MTDLWFKSLHELSAEIDAGHLSSAEIVDAFLGRIDRHDDKLHAFIDLYADEAREAARTADTAIAAGKRIGPLHGLPIALKDIIDMEGRVTTGGSMALADRISPVTATVATRLLDAGMIVLGKTHTVEFASGGWGTNTRMGTPWNPWDLDTHRCPGGSSAGSGVAVGAGLAPSAIGTDTGGSVRLPAGWCGITGLKVSVGRISTWGILPLSQTLDTPGPIVRDIQDAVLLYNALQGPDPNDPLTLGRHAPDPSPDLGRGVKGLRLGILPDDERDGIDPEVAAAYDASVAQLADAGAEIVPLTFPHPLRKLVVLAARVMDGEGYACNAALVDDPDAPLDEDVRPRLTGGRTMSVKDFQDVLREREAVIREFEPAFAGVDGWLAPTARTAAPRVEDADQKDTPGGFTRPVNTLGQCAVSVPNGQTASGLPTSLQIACRPYDEAMALRIGQAWQQMTDWHTQHPELPE